MAQTQGSIWVDITGACTGSSSEASPDSVCSWTTTAPTLHMPRALQGGAVLPQGEGARGKAKKSDMTEITWTEEPGELQSMGSQSVSCEGGPGGSSISPSNEYSRLISFRIDWFDLLAAQRTLNSIVASKHHNSKESTLFSFFYSPALMSRLDYWKKPLPATASQGTWAIDGLTHPRGFQALIPLPH